MCINKPSNLKRRKVRNLNGEMSEQEEYCEIKNQPRGYKKGDEVEDSRYIEKTVYVLSTVGVILLTHVIIWCHAAIPVVFAVATPLLIGIKTIYYWRFKWQFFMIDLCYFVNAVTYIYLWLPDNEHLFRMVFGLANGPVLVAAAVYRNSMVFHNHDKITSCYIHFLPALLTFCTRWFPAETSQFWFRTFTPEIPQFDALWLYAVPFGFYFLHSVFYFTVVNVTVKPKDPYVTSYSYLTDKFEHLDCIGGTWGQCFMYYLLSWLFCLASLCLSMLSYCYFPAHCASLALVFSVVVYNGGSYYVHVFSERGFDTSD